MKEIYFNTTKYWVSLYPLAFLSGFASITLFHPRAICKATVVSMWSLLDGSMSPAIEPHLPGDPNAEFSELAIIPFPHDHAVASHPTILRTLIILCFVAVLCAVDVISLFNTFLLATIMTIWVFVTVLVPSDVIVLLHHYCTIPSLLFADAMCKHLPQEPGVSNVTATTL